MLKDDGVFWWLIGGLLVLIAAVAALIFVMIASPRPAKATDLRGEFVQYTPSQRQWLRNIPVPGKTVACCNENDGTKAEEEIKDGNYYASFEACRFVADVGLQCELVPSMRVPDAAIVQEPNKIGRPVVWYWWDGNKWAIKCYLRGVGI